MEQLHTYRYPNADIAGDAVKGQREAKQLKYKACSMQGTKHAGYKACRVQSMQGTGLLDVRDAFVPKKNLQHVLSILGIEAVSRQAAGRCK